MKTVYCKIEDNLYQGGTPDNQLPRNITAVLSLQNAQSADGQPNVLIHIRMPIDDGLFPGMHWLHAAVKIVETMIDTGHTVYIHCHAGVSRSAMVTIAYLMKKHAWSLQKAMDHVGARNGIIAPNPRFIIGLREYEEVLKG